MAFRLPRDARVVRFPSGDGLQLEGRLTGGSRRHGVVLCPPHPLYGGSMLTPVILTVEAAFRAAGFTTLAFNFRGVGASEGTHGEGRTEVERRRGRARPSEGGARRSARPGRRRGLLVREPRRRPGRLGGPGRRILPGRGPRPGPLRLRLPGRPPRPGRAHRRSPRRALRSGAHRGSGGEPPGGGRGSACSRRTTSSPTRWTTSPARARTPSSGRRADRLRSHARWITEGLLVSNVIHRSPM